MVNGGQLMQGSDIAEPDDGFGDLRYPIDDPLQSVPAARTEDRIDRGVPQGLGQIRQTVVIRAGKPSPRIARVRALAHYISPRAQTRSRPVDIGGIDNSGGRYDTDMSHKYILYSSQLTKRLGSR